MLLVGLVTALPFALWEGLPNEARSGDWTFAALAAVGDVCGLGFIYMAFRKGPLALVAPIASAQGATATLISVLTGERLTGLDTLGLGAVMAGMIVVLSHQHRNREEPEGSDRFTSALLALGSCVAIGVALYSLSRSSVDLGTAWTIVVLRGGGLALLGIALGIRRLPLVPRESLQFVVPAGIIDNFGFVFFLIGTAAGSIAIPAVVGSQFSIVAALIGILLFGERLVRVQLVGLSIIVIGVAILAAQTS